jgi:hypothetical protein
MRPEALAAGAAAGALSTLFFFFSLLLPRDALRLLLLRLLDRAK